MYIDPASRHIASPTLSPVRVLPRHPVLDEGDAAEVRLLATLLLRQCGGLYLTIVAGAEPDHKALKLCCRDGFWRSVDLELHECNRQRQRLKEIAHPMIGELAALWPPNARPRGIGIMTDGSGIVFSPDLPCPDIVGWPAMLLEGSARSVDLLPFAEKSTWSMMSMATGSAH